MTFRFQNHGWEPWTIWGIRVGWLYDGRERGGRSWGFEVWAGPWVWTVLFNPEPLRE